jgi:hypothetical protein
VISDLHEDRATGRLVLVSRLRWVRMATYCTATGDTPAAVHARRRKRQWVDGVQCKVAPDGNVWISIDEMNRRPPDTEVNGAADQPAGCG